MAKKQNQQEMNKHGIHKRQQTTCDGRFNCDYRNSSKRRYKRGPFRVHVRDFDGSNEPTMEAQVRPLAQPLTEQLSNSLCGPRPR